MLTTSFLYPFRLGAVFVFKLIFCCVCFKYINDIIKSLADAQACLYCNRFAFIFIIIVYYFSCLFFVSVSKFVSNERRIMAVLRVDFKSF